MSDLKLPPMTVQHMARTLATTRERATRAERERCAQLIEDQADILLGTGAVELSAIVRELATLVRSPAPVELPPGETMMVEHGQPVLGIGRDEQVLPDVHHMDDFAEGRALVQGGMHKRAVVGYTGRLGHLRGD